MVGETNVAMKTIPVKHRPAASRRGDDGPPCDERGDIQHKEVRIPVEGVTLEAELCVPHAANGLVVFAHGWSRHTPRHQFIAWNLQCAGFGTLQLDMLTREEELDDTSDGHVRLDVRMLTRRLMGATIWSATQDATRHLALGYFGARTAAAAALLAAARLGHAVAAIVLRGGHPELAHAELSRVVTPTLFIVPEGNRSLLEANRKACEQLAGESEVAIVPEESCVFSEPPAVAALACQWFKRHLAPTHRLVG